MIHKVPLKSTYSILCLLIFSMNVVGQGIQPPMQLNGLRSSNSNEISQMSAIPVSQFTGRAAVTVPLTELSNTDIQLPISLEYNTSGCKPDEHPSSVGLNWALSAGGVIARTVKSIPDEFRTTDLMGYPNKSYLDYYTTNAASDWANSATYANIGENEDRAPDIFTFNLNGISGSFTLNHEGKWKIKSKEGHDIFVEFVVRYQGDYFCDAITEFRLTLNDGTQYIFGRNTPAIEFSLPAFYNDDATGSNATDAANNYVFPTAWYLTEIVSAKGRHVNFTYVNDYCFKQVSYSSQFLDNVNNGLNKNGKTKYLIKAAYLSKIVSDNGISCEFTRSISNELKYIFDSENSDPRYCFGFEIYFPGGSDNENPCAYCLYTGNYYKIDNIKLKSGDEVIKNINLEYIENSSERLKLKKVKFQNYYQGNAVGAEYAFEYNPLKLPPYNEGKEDHWGYYNGKNYWTTENGVNDVVNHMPEYNNSRAANADLMKAEILTKIIYPTKGYTVFQYEPHDYSSIVVATGSDILPPLTVNVQNSNTMAGGLRIKKIETYDGISSTPLTKEYFYSKNYIGGGTLSSGVCGGLPIYTVSYTLGNNQVKRYFSSLPLEYLSLTGGSLITYSEVTEKSSEGFITTFYTNHDNGFLDKTPLAVYCGFQTSSLAKYSYSSLELERGLPKSIKYYASDKFLVKQITNTYNDDPNRYNIYVRSVERISPMDLLPKLVVGTLFYTFYPYLKSTEEKEYLRAGGTISQQKDYTYESAHNCLKSSSFSNSEGKNFMTTYSYCFDYPSSSSSQIEGAYALLTKKIYGTPMEITNYQDINRTWVMVNSNLSTFKLVNGLALPYKQYSIANNLTQTSFLPASVSADGSTFNKDSKYKQDAAYEAYDTKGNLLQQTNKNGTASYLWDYNQSMPVAEVLNGTADQIAYNGFESGVNPGASGWETLANQKSAFNYWADNMISRQNAYAGNFSLILFKANSTDVYNFGPTININPELKSGKYKMSCWVKTPIGYTSNKAFLCMYTIDRNSCCALYPTTAQFSQTFIPPTNGEWKYFETIIDYGAISGPTPANVKVSIRCYIANTDQNFDINVDEMRIHRIDAQMTTYAYNPLVGINSTLDENNRLVNRYSYDEFQRLRTIYDNEYNIVKAYDYKTKGNFVITCEGVINASTTNGNIIPDEPFREVNQDGELNYFLGKDFDLKINGVLKALPYTSPSGTVFSKFLTDNRYWNLKVSAVKSDEKFAVILK